MPLLGESPKMDVMHMADRDLLEDEDLSVLLQLASHSNTPRSKDGRYVGQVPGERWNNGVICDLLDCFILQRRLSITSW